MSHTTVSRIYKKYKETGTTANIPKPGRPKLLDERNCRYLIRKVIENPAITSNQIQNNMKEVINKNIHSSSIRRLLLQNNIKSYVAKKKPFLSKKQMKKRLDWCKAYRYMTSDYWKKIIFSDESTFCIKMDIVNKRIRRSSLDNAYKSKYLQQTIKFPPYWMIWGCFRDNELGPLVFINGTVNSIKYKEILEKNLVNFIKPGDIFQDDSAPAHRSKSVLSFLDEERIEHLDWPSNSPDLNPIEHVWSMMSKKLKSKLITNKSTLKDEIKKIWENGISKEYLEKLVESMPNRISECIKNKGGVTKY